MTGTARSTPKSAQQNRKDQRLQRGGSGGDEGAGQALSRRRPGKVCLIQ